MVAQFALKPHARYARGSLFDSRFFVGKYNRGSPLDHETTIILPPEKYPLYGMLHARMRKPM